jgi:hypothetical protein
MSKNGGKKTSSGQQQLRQRHRQQMAQDKREEKRIQQRMEAYSTQTNQYMLKFYMVLATAVVVTVVSILHHVKPRFLYGAKQTKAPPFFLGTCYGPKVNLKQSLPYFFRSYSIATDDNLRERKAMRRVFHNSKKLNSAGAPSVLKGWDDTKLDFYIRQRNLCGDDFEQAYQEALDNQDWMRQQDLVEWCLLTTRVVEGFLMTNVTIHNSPLIFLKERGLLLESKRSGYSTAAYLEPRHDPLEDRTRMAQLPSLVLTWLLTNDIAISGADYREELHAYVEQLVQRRGKEKYLILEEDCSSPTKPRRTMLSTCEVDLEDLSRKDGTCCYYVLPMSASSHFQDREDEDEDENNKNDNFKSSSLRR